MSIKRPQIDQPNLMATPFFVSGLSDGSEQRIERGKSWYTIDEALTQEIVQPLLETHGNILQAVSNSLANCGLEVPIYVAGSSVTQKVETLEVDINTSTDIDLFIPNMTQQGFGTFLETLHTQFPDAQLEMKSSRSNPDGRKVIILIVNGRKYEITPYDGDFLEYSQDLVSGQLVVSYSPEDISVLSAYENIEQVLDTGFKLPLSESDLLGYEWIYYSLRYLSEACMHGGIYPDKMVLDVIRNRFSSFDITKIDDKLLNELERAFSIKLKEEFDRINKSHEKDSRLFIAFLGYTNLMRKMLPVTWTLAHFTTPSIYHDFIGQQVTFEEFSEKLKIGNPKLIDDDILAMVGLTVEDLKTSDWQLSPLINQRIMSAANRYYYIGTQDLKEHKSWTKDGIIQAANKLVTLLKGHNIEKNVDEVIDDIVSTSEEFRGWRAVHVRDNFPLIRYLYPDFDRSIVSYREQIGFMEKLSGIAAHSDVIGYILCDLLFDIYTNDMPAGRRKTIVKRELVFKFLNNLGFIPAADPRAKEKSVYLHNFKKLKNVGVVDILGKISEPEVFGLPLEKYKELDEETFQFLLGNVFMILIESIEGI